MATGNLPPIEEPQAYSGLLPAIWQTWAAACFRPREFFSSVGNNQALTPALLFGVGCVWIGLFIVSLWVAMLPPYPGEYEQVQLVINVVRMCCCGWIYPLIGVFLGGLLLHLFLALFGGANRGLTTTLRVVAYAQAPALFSIVPILGSCVGSVWGLVLCIIGLAAAHRTETWRAVLAVFVPCVLCIGIGIIAGGFLYYVYHPPS